MSGAFVGEPPRPIRRQIDDKFAAGVINNISLKIPFHMGYKSFIAIVDLMRNLPAPHIKYTFREKLIVD